MGLLTARGERRYPGVAFFRDEDIDRQLFFGRQRDIHRLVHLTRAERLVVLLARSGIGKSSLINAGLMQPLRDTGYFPMVVRVNSSRGDVTASIYTGVEVACEQGVTRGVIDSYEPGNPADWDRRSLWHFMKTLYLWRDDALLQPVLIIDQFEELFTLVPAKSRRAFVEQLADVVRGRRPETTTAGGDSDGALSDRRPPVTVVLAIREDFLAHLEEMAVLIPSILRARYRLGPLRVEEALLAITEPAKLKLSELATPPFKWSEEAATCVVNFLRQRRSRADSVHRREAIEPFQLQLVCQYVEDLASRRHMDVIGLEHLGGARAGARLGGILVRFYQRCLTTTRRKYQPLHMRRLRLEELCEQELISAGGRRRLCEESSIVRNNRVPREVLGELVELRLIRKEDRVGDSYYELAHDTLIEPILDGRLRRERRRRWGRVVAAMVGMVGGAALWWSAVVGERVANLRYNEDVWAALRVSDRIVVGDVIEEQHLGFFERAAGGVVLDAFDIADVGRKMDVRIDVTSSEFRPFLLTQAANGEISGNRYRGFDGSVVVSVEEPVRIVVTSDSGGDTGGYTVAVRELAPGEWVGPVDRRDLERAAVINGVGMWRELSAGDEVRGVLEDGDAFHGWTLEGWVVQLERGQTVRVTLMSERFDPYLVVESPAGRVLVDDDSGGSLNSSLEVSGGEGGRARIIATNFSGGGVGAYGLSVERVN